MTSLLKEKLALYKALFSKPRHEWTGDDTELGITLIRDTELKGHIERALDVLDRTDNQPVVKETKSLKEPMAPGIISLISEMENAQ